MTCLLSHSKTQQCARESHSTRVAWPAAADEAERQYEVPVKMKTNMFYKTCFIFLLNWIFTIDFERGRIVATIAIHRDFNWKKIGYSVIKKGK